MPERIKTYYLASGHISIPVLEKLLAAQELELVGIASQLKTSKSNGPKRTVQGPIVGYCEEHGIPVTRVSSVNTEDFHALLRVLGVEILVVASFGQLLKPALLELPKYGCLNVHASLLPKYRGASPIVASILNGEERTGVSFMRMEAGLDTGPIYRMVDLPILPEDNADSLEERLGRLAGEHIEQVIVDIVRNGLQPVPQPQEGATYARKISKEDGVAVWERSARELYWMSKAYNPWPSLKAMLPTKSGKPKMIKITKASPLETVRTGAEPGDILAYGRDGIIVACGQGALKIERLTPEGKKEMPAKDYLLGTPIPADDQKMQNV